MIFQRGVFRRPNGPVLIAVATCVCYLVITLSTLTMFPKVWQDTSWTSLQGFSLAFDGRLANPMWDRYDFEKHILAPRVFQPVCLSYLYRSFDFGLFQGRVLSLIFGLILLVCVYIFAARMFGEIVAAVAIVILFIDNVFFVTSRTIRPDIIVATFCMLSLFLVIMGLERKRKEFLFFAGIFSGVALYTHPNSLLSLFAILLIILKEIWLTKVRKWVIWIFLGGLVLGFSPYAVYVCVEDFENGFETFFSQVGVGTYYSKASIIARYSQESMRYANYLQFPYRMLIVLVQLVSLFAGIFCSEQRIRDLCLYVFVFLIFLPILNPMNQTSRYFMVVIPCLSIILAYFVVAIFTEEVWTRRSTHSRLRIAAGIIFVSFIFNHVLGDLWVLWTHRNHDYYAFVEELREDIPKGSRVWGSLTFWIGMTDCDFRSQLTSIEGVRAFRPEFVILYDHEVWGRRSATLGVLRKEPLPGFDAIQRVVEGWAKERGKLVGRVVSEYYGNIEVFKLDWTDAKN